MSWIFGPGTVGSVNPGQGSVYGVPGLQWLFGPGIVGAVPTFNYPAAVLPLSSSGSSINIPANHIAIMSKNRRLVQFLNLDDFVSTSGRDRLYNGPNSFRITVGTQVKEYQGNLPMKPRGDGAVYIWSDGVQRSSHFVWSNSPVPPEEQDLEKA
jgi:hypothetical protein